MVKVKSDVLTLADLVALDYQAERMIRDRHPFFGRLIARIKGATVSASKKATEDFIESFRLSAEEAKVARGVHRLFHS